MLIHEMEQRSEEWHEIRRGKMTASNAAAIAAGSKGLETYVYQLMAEKFSNNREEGYCGPDMKRGIELEDQARMTYEIEQESVQQVGFIEYDEYTGCSPDGLVGDDGGVEIKCVNDQNFFRLAIDGEKAIDSKYLWQVQMCLLITGRSWWDLVFYNVNFEKNMRVFRITTDLEKKERLAVGIAKGTKLIQELTQRYESK